MESGAAPVSPQRDGAASALRARRQLLLGEVRKGLPLRRETAEALPVAPVLAGLFGASGLQRGATVVLAGGEGQGMTSLALGLCGASTGEGLWAGIVNLSRVGLLGASELGVALDRLVVISQPVERVAAVAAALMEACSVVLLGADRPLGRREAERLQRRAHEYRCALVVLAPSASRRRDTDRGGRWPAVPDHTLTVVGSTPVGLGRGTGHLVARRLRVEVVHRRDSVPLHRHEIVLPAVPPATFAAEETAPRVQGMHRVG